MFLLISGPSSRHKNIPSCSPQPYLSKSDIQTSPFSPFYPVAEITHPWEHRHGAQTFLHWAFGTSELRTGRMYTALAVPNNNSFWWSTRIDGSKPRRSWICFLKVQGLHLGNNGFLVIISLGFSLSVVTLKHGYCRFLNHAVKKHPETSSRGLPFNITSWWNELFSIPRLQILLTEGQASLLFPLMKKENFTSDELEQGSYSELPHKFLSRKSYSVLASYNIPEMRAKKQQKIGTSYFTAHRHKNWNMINPNYLYFSFSDFLSHTNILKLYLNIPKWYVTLCLGLLEKVMLVFPKTLEIFHIQLVPNFLLLKIRNRADW